MNRYHGEHCKENPNRIPPIVGNFHYWKITHIKSGTIELTTGITEWCIDREMQAPIMSQIANKVKHRKSHRGYTCEKLTKYEYDELMKIQNNE